jgi:prolyl oligopeptidase
MAWNRVIRSISIGLAFGLLLGSTALGQKIVGGVEPTRNEQPTWEKNHGITVYDPYRWLEVLDDPNLAPWIREQNSQTKAALDAEIYAAVRTEFETYYGTKSLADRPDGWLDHHERGNDWRRDPAGGRAPGLTQSEMTSPSGRYELRATSDSSSDLQVIRIFDTQNQAFLSDLLITKFIEVLWAADEASFIYTYDGDGRTGESFPGIKEHKLGTAQNLDRVIYEPAHPDTSITLFKADDTFVMQESRGYQERFATLEPATGAVQEILGWSAGVSSAIAAEAGVLYLKAYRLAANGNVLSLTLADGQLAVAVPETELALDQVVKIGSAYYLAYVRNAEHALFVYRDGQATEIALPAQGGGVSIYEAAGELNFSFASYSALASTWRVDPATLATEVVTPAERTPVDVVAEKVFYTSSSGIQAPIWLIRASTTKLDENTPVYLYGYGGFRINLLPYFTYSILPWLTRGGVYAVVTLPGGLEFGESWHQAGMRLNKRAVFDDFAAAGRHLVSLGYTSPKKLAIGGGSNGGLLVGSTMNLYPNDFQAAVPEVGVMDLTRFELFTAGKWWTDEYGSRSSARDYRNMLALSPLHNLRRRAYPHTMVMTADLDDRVVPSHSYKYAARLQAVQQDGRDALLYVKRGGSHSSRSGTKAAFLDYITTKWTFLLGAVNKE